MNKTTLATLAGLLGYSIFGFSFLFSKIALELASPLTLLALRFVVAFLVLNLLLLAGKASIDLKGKPVKLLLLMGLVQPILYFICETYGIAMTSASFSGVMIGLAPVMGLIFGVIFLKEHCTLFQALCTGLSVVGVCLTTTGGFGNVSLTGFFLLLGAITSAAFFTILSRSIAPHFSAFERTYVMFALGSVFFALVALAENRSDPAALLRPLAVPSFWVCLLYLAVVSSVCAFLLINLALNHISAGRALIFSNFTTVISVLAGIFVLGDSFTLTQLLGIVIITVGVFGVSWQKSGEN